MIKNNYHFFAARWANTAVESLTIHTRALLRKEEQKTSSSQKNPFPMPRMLQSYCFQYISKTSQHASETFLGGSSTLRNGVSFPLQQSGSLVTRCLHLTLRWGLSPPSESISHQRHSYAGKHSGHPCGSLIKSTRYNRPSGQLILFVLLQIRCLLPIQSLILFSSNLPVIKVGNTHLK